jgi:hypothetical protein
MRCCVASSCDHLSSASALMLSVILSCLARLTGRGVMTAAPPAAAAAPDVLVPAARALAAAFSARAAIRAASGDDVGSMATGGLAAVAVLLLLLAGGLIVEPCWPGCGEAAPGLPGASARGLL